jgi:hypothetical protein
MHQGFDGVYNARYRIGKCNRFIATGPAETQKPQLYSTPIIFCEWV